MFVKSNIIFFQCTENIWYYFVIFVPNYCLFGLNAASDRCSVWSLGKVPT